MNLFGECDYMCTCEFLEIVFDIIESNFVACLSRTADSLLK